MPNRQLHSAVTHVLCTDIARHARDNLQIMQKDIFSLHTNLTHFKSIIYVSADLHGKRSIMVYPKHVENLNFCQTSSPWQWPERFKTRRAKGNDLTKEYESYLMVKSGYLNKAHLVQYTRAERINKIGGHASKILRYCPTGTPALSRCDI
jgi:hypothetical protein